MILPTAITSPMRVVSIDQEYRPPEYGIERFPVWVYSLRVDHEQSERMVRDWDRSQPSSYIVFDEFKFCTETQLPIGVGDLFTPDLVPFDAIPENDEERARREARERILSTLRMASPGFMVIGGDDDAVG